MITNMHPNCVWLNVERLIKEHPNNPHYQDIFRFKSLSMEERARETLTKYPKMNIPDLSDECDCPLEEARELYHKVMAERRAKRLNLLTG